MIELPEAATIAGQITTELQGKRVARGMRGNSPHKFAFYSGEPEDYERILEGKVVGPAEPFGSCLAVKLEPGYGLVLGDGGERILYHTSEATLPKKHHLLLEFDDDTYLSVGIMGWGAAQLVPWEDLATQTFAGPRLLSPLDAEYTAAHLKSLFADALPDDSRTMKAAIVRRPGVVGVGNGYLQDILFRARLHPRRRLTSMTPAEWRGLHKAIKTTITQATKAGGRDTERDLYGARGQYVALMDTRTAGGPCPECETPIEKISYQGGSCYLCPKCQKLG